VVPEGGDRLTEGGKIMLPGQMRGAHGGKGRRGQSGGGQGGAQGAAPAAAPTAGGQPGAQAQPSGGEGQGGGQGGGFAPSPEMQAARQAVRQACGADIQKLCAGAKGREAMMCLRQNADQASAGCKAALAKLPHRAPSGDHQGGGQGGGEG
jgi:hypothetical protein